MTRRILSLAAVALVALILQSAVAAVLPASLSPDFALLLAIAMAVAAPAVEGLTVSAGLGYGADLLSGSLLGHHALLRIGVFAATRSVALQFHLRRGLSLAFFAFVMTGLDALGTAVLGWLFSGDPMLIFQRPLGLLLRATVNALCAPAVLGVVVTVLELLIERESRRRDVRLETRRPVL